MGADLKPVSRRAAERCHWLKPGEEVAGQETSAGKSNRNNRPLYATLSPADSA